jgi:hypothetical protein
MSFDTLLQPFVDGKPALADEVLIKASIDPLVVASDVGWVRLETTDGGAEVYGYDNLQSGFIINHAEGEAVWDLVVAIASSSRLAILPVGCPTCVGDPGLLADLPPDLADGAVVVASGSDLADIIFNS